MSVPGTRVCVLQTCIRQPTTVERITLTAIAFPIPDDVIAIAGHRGIPWRRGVAASPERSCAGTRFASQVLRGWSLCPGRRIGRDHGCIRKQHRAGARGAPGAAQVVPKAFLSRVWIAGKGREEIWFRGGSWRHVPRHRADLGACSYPLMAAAADPDGRRTFVRPRRRCSRAARPSEVVCGGTAFRKRQTISAWMKNGAMDGTRNSSYQNLGERRMLSEIGIWV
jgi:hypothetical protein